MMILADEGYEENTAVEAMAYLRSSLLLDI